MAVSSNSTRMRGRIPAAAISATWVYPEAAILLADARARLAEATVVRIKAPAGARAA